MRVAIWTPLPPQWGEVARHASVLVRALASGADVVVVAADDVAASVAAPDGVPVVAASDEAAHEADLDVYQMANDALLHGYMHSSALRRPGMLILNDPALVDFYLRIGGGPTGAVFRSEVAFNCPEAAAGPGVAAGQPGFDALSLLLSRRLVEASLMTVVHSSWAATELARRSPGADVVRAPRPIEIDAASEPRPDAGAVVFGAVGGLAESRRLAQLVAAFGEIRGEFAGARLVIAVDDPRREEAVSAVVTDAGPPDAVTLLHGSPAGRGLAAVLARCDVLVDLTSPTTGATSSALLVALSAGRPVVVDEAPQYRELDGRFCWLLPTEAGRGEAALRATLRLAASDPTAVRAAGRLAAELVAPIEAPEALAETYLALARACAARRQGAIPSAARDLASRRRVAVNAIGSWEATTGLTEAARRAVGALVDVGVDVAMEDYDYGAPLEPRRFPARLRALPKGRLYDVDLCFLNVNELTLVPDEYLHEPGRRRRVVAYWHWEQVSLPEEMRAQLDRVDEIWVSSEFIAETFRHYTTKPVAVVPCVVEPVANSALRRADFGLPESSCLFFFHFDVNSTVARKNPHGVIEAYRRAFTPAERDGSVHLVLKTINLASHAEAAAMLGEAMASVGGTVLDADLPTEDVAALTALSDVYVSLHRAEGFGLGLAEAMYFGKPVIGTAYSGNMDFMTIENSCPIGYRMAQIDLGELRFNRWSEKVYRPGEWWAEPDLDDAARRMRALFEDRGLRERLGQAGARTIRERCNGRVVGCRMRALLARGAAAAVVPSSPPASWPAGSRSPAEGCSAS
jgi:glycosyltransferase involved in cell wall biosynthesis